MKNLKLNYIVIPLITIAVAITGSIFTQAGMPWYDSTLIKPDLTPPDWVFPVVWNTIFLLTTLSALIVWNKGYEEKRFLLFFKRIKIAPAFSIIISLYLANAVLNVFWSFLFFYSQRISSAFVEIFFLEGTLIALIILTWRVSRTASLLLLPYALWVGFASYLNYLILVLN